MKYIDLIVPLIITAIFLYGVLKKINTVDIFIDGAKEGLKTAVEILPALILLMTAVEMFTSSGVDKALAELLSPVTSFLGFPKECVPLAVIRPVSGSGALATLENVLAEVSPDSFAGLVASVLMGSTETTFYTITVYFSAIRKKADTRIFIASAVGDLTGFIFSALTVRLMFF